MALALAAISNTLTYLEPILWAVALFAFLRTKQHAQFPALKFVLSFRLLSTCLLVGIQQAYRVAPQIDAHLLSNSYFYTYWVTYFVGFALFLLSLLDIFRYTMASLQGLSRLGLIGFRWAGVVSLLVAIASVVRTASFQGLHGHLNWIIADIAGNLSVLALCLIAFVAVCMHTLGLNLRNRVAGFCLGFSIMAIANMIAFAFRNVGNDALPNQLALIATSIALIVWVGYILMPEPVRKQAAVPTPAKLLRWNDLALALGHSEPETAAAGQNGFLQNVEGVVDRVLAKNSMGSVS